MAGEEILAALQSPLYSGAETYSGIAAGGVANALPALVDPYGSTGSNALNVFGGTILAALLGNMAKSDAAEQNASIATKQSQFMSASPQERLALTQQDPRTFAKLQAALNTNDLLQQAQDKATQRQLEIQDPFKVAAEKRALQDTIALKTNTDILQAELGIASAKKQIENKIDSGKPLSTKDISDLKIRVDSDIAGSPEARNYSEVLTQVTALKNAIKSNDPVAARSAMYLVAKAADPSVVQGGELAFWKSSGGLGDQAEQYFNDLQSGNLSPTLKKGLESVADNLVNSRYSVYKNAGDTRLKTLSGTLGVGPTETGINLYPAPSFESAPTSPEDAKRAFAIEAKAKGLTAQEARAAWAAQGGQ